MSEKKSLASRANWAKLSQAERSSRMSRVAVSRWTKWRALKDKNNNK